MNDKNNSTKTPTSKKKSSPGVLDVFLFKSSLTTFTAVRRAQSRRPSGFLRAPVRMTAAAAASVLETRLRSSQRQRVAPLIDYTPNKVINNKSAVYRRFCNILRTSFALKIQRYNQKRELNFERKKAYTVLFSCWCMKVTSSWHRFPPPC